MPDPDPRTYRRQDWLLYLALTLWIAAWAFDLVFFPFEHPAMLFAVPGGLGAAIVLLQLGVPDLRFSGLANMIGLITLLSTTGLGLLFRAV